MRRWRPVHAESKSQWKGKVAGAYEGRHQHVNSSTLPNESDVYAITEGLDCWISGDGCSGLSPPPGKKVCVPRRAPKARSTNITVRLRTSNPQLSRLELPAVVATSNLSTPSGRLRAIQRTSIYVLAAGSLAELTPHRAKHRDSTEKVTLPPPWLRRPTSSAPHGRHSARRSIQARRPVMPSRAQ
jgi:hypothetical protein